MRLFPPLFVPTVLFAAGGSKIHTNVWFIDGNNVMGHKGTPKDRAVLAEKLSRIQPGSSNDRVILVWDGSKETSAKSDVKTATVPSDETTLLSVPVLSPGMSADEYIEEEIKQMMHSTTVGKKKWRVQVVTADRALRRRVLKIKPIVYGCVNPVTFWRRYLPRLCGLKQQKQPEETENDDE